MGNFSRAVSLVSSMPTSTFVGLLGKWHPSEDVNFFSAHQRREVLPSRSFCGSAHAQSCVLSRFLGFSSLFRRRVLIDGESCPPRSPVFLVFGTLSTLALPLDSFHGGVFTSSPHRSRPPKPSTKPSKLAEFLADQAIHGERSAHKGLAPAGMTTVPPTAPEIPEGDLPAPPAETAKSVLDAQGPEAMAAWVRKKKSVMVTDTTMRDAHQV